MSITALLLWTLPLLSSTLARPTQSIKSLVVIGDSFSDNGNGAYRLTNFSWPADPAYDHGRFSNGPVWVEDVAQKFGWELKDYAVGGATSNNTAVQGYTGPASDVPTPSALDQAAQYLSSPSTSPRSTVYAILTGANDVFFNPAITAATPVAAVAAIARKLGEAGATRFALGTYPDFARIPFGATYADAATARALHAYSTALRAGLTRLAADLRAHGAEVALVDTYALFEDVHAHPARYGFSAAALGTSCLVGAYGEAPRALCARPGEFVWWDEFHPTAKSHKYMAALAAEEIARAFRL